MEHFLNMKHSLTFGPVRFDIPEKLLHDRSFLFGFHDLLILDVISKGKIFVTPHQPAVFDHAVNGEADTL